MKKFKVILPIVLALAALIAVFAVFATKDKPTPDPSDPSAVATTPVPAEKVNVAVLKGPTGLGALQILDTPDEYNTQVLAAPTDIPPLLVTKKVDIAALPLNLAATLYNKNSDIVLLNVNTLGVLYLLEKGNTVQKIADLKGKTVYASGQGATPEYVLNYLLEGAKLDPKKDVKIEWLADHQALSLQLISGKADIALLPEPNVTNVLRKNKDLRVALDLNKAWEEAAEGGKLAMGCVVARKDFVKNNPEAVEKFINDYTSSVHFVNGNPAPAALLAVKYKIVDDAAIAQAVIPNCQLVSIVGADAKKVAEENFKVLFNANPASVGGKLPGNDFYK
ncbi:MAG: ABC transporter substrate-binding protein [Oscillospiraceae bacterium]|jgi:NitT/TauT family transport system substrate-binding protein|nr:ABC transporter substrate-binding protein [Oscillospiraceae bacterium]